MPDFDDLKLGAAPPEFSPRLIPLEAVQARAIVLPDTFDLEEQIGTPPWEDHGNTQYGDCTVAAAAGIQRRFQKREHPGREWTSFPRQNVVDFYFSLGDRQDTGRYEIDVLRAWRRRGLLAADGRHYKNRAFFAANHQDWYAVATAIYTFGAVTLTFGLPEGWAGVLTGQTPGTVLPENVGDVGSWGYHEIPACAFGFGPNGEPGLWGEFESWAADNRKFIPWNAVMQYCVECYGVVDAWDSPRLARLLDVPLARTLVRNITGDEEA
jgi:hypothetical protein